MTNFEMAKYILAIVKESGAIFMSWGPRSFVAIPNGLQFRVSGFKHKGLVRVTYNEGHDLFDVQFLTLKGRLIERKEQIFIDELAEVIDNFVEYTKNYDKSVENWLKKTKF
jgi:hypothetical protein